MISAHHHSSQSFRSLLLLSAIAISPAAAQTAPAALPPPPQGAWPKTSIQQGRYFSFAVPAGWQMNESTNGVDLGNPDGSEAINFVGLEGTPGTSSPRQQIDKLGTWLKVRFVISETRPRPSQNGFDTAEFLFSFVDAKGRSCLGWAWSVVNNSLGRNNAYMEIAWATADIWPRDQQFLVATARLVNVTNPQQAFQRDQLLRSGVAAGPGSAGGYNHPNTFTPNSNQAAMDRISAQRSNTTLDRYPLMDPSTGRTYTGTSSTYDFVRGGWVNPNDHTQLLKEVKPGGI